MKKIIITIIIVAFFALAYWLISPIFIDKKVSEDLPVSTNDAENSENAMNQIREIKKGGFTGFDSTHTGSGTARIVTVDGRNYIRFDDDFNVSNGPDLYVGLGKAGNYVKNSEIGILKGNIGSQNYELPETIDPRSIEEIWIWCRAFSEPFARAVLE